MDVKQSGRSISSWLGRPGGRPSAAVGGGGPVASFFQVEPTGLSRSAPRRAAHVALRYFPIFIFNFTMWKPIIFLHERSRRGVRERGNEGVGWRLLIRVGVLLQTPAPRRASAAAAAARRGSRIDPASRGVTTRHRDLTNKIKKHYQNRIKRSNPFGARPDLLGRSPQKSQSQQRRNTTWWTARIFAHNTKKDSILNLICFTKRGFVSGRQDSRHLT